MSTRLRLSVQEFLTSNEPRRLYVALQILLSPFALVFGLGVHLRRKLYAAGVFKSVRLSHPVISVGNLTVGGTGKTPFEIYLVGLLRQMNLRPLLLSRGYKAKAPGVRAGAGATAPAPLPDELSMLARRYPDLDLAWGRDRVKAYREACRVARFDLVVLDDGFQHLRIQRDLDLLILDAARAFGTGRLLPAGDMRDSFKRARDAHAWILNFKGLTPDHPIRSDLLDQGSKLPIFRGRYCFLGASYLASGKAAAWPPAADSKAAVITAVGDPESFLSLLRAEGVEISEEFVFPDHHAFSERDVKEVRSRCQASGVEFLLTTAKDAVKLARFPFEKLSVLVIHINFRLESGEAELREMISHLAVHGKEI